MAAWDPMAGQIKSMLGAQPSSQHMSFPSYGFGSGTRDQANKVFVSHEHSKLATTGVSPGPASFGGAATLGPQADGAIRSAPSWNFGSARRFNAFDRENVPGPGSYSARSSLGAQVTGEQQSMPIFGMGSSTRDGVKRVYISEQHSTIALQGMSSPGPASYTLIPAVGKQGASTKASQPSFGFGSNKRFIDADVRRAAKQPGPDQYDMPSTLGIQAASTRRSAPLAGFGSSTRTDAAKMYTSPQAEKTKGFGRQSPGPMTYLPPVNKRNGPSFGFGSCDRFYMGKIARRVANGPSPAHYNV